jgi:hypothetical protein
MRHTSPDCASTVNGEELELADGGTLLIAPETGIEG